MTASAQQNATSEGMAFYEKLAFFEIAFGLDIKRGRHGLGLRSCFFPPLFATGSLQKLPPVINREASNFWTQKQ